MMKKNKNIKELEAKTSELNNIWENKWLFTPLLRITTFYAPYTEIRDVNNVPLKGQFGVPTSQCALKGPFGVPKMYQCHIPHQRLVNLDQLEVNFWKYSNALWAYVWASNV